MATARTIKANIMIDTSAITASLRSMSRAARQTGRNVTTRPVSAERKAIQQIGKQEMDAARRWLQRLLMQERITLGLPTCSAVCGPVPKLRGETFECALEPQHRGDHESVDRANWSDPVNDRKLA